MSIEDFIKNFDWKKDAEEWAELDAKLTREEWKKFIAHIRKTERDRILEKLEGLKGRNILNSPTIGKLISAIKEEKE